MPSRLYAALVVSAAVLFSPVAAFAQQNPVPPDGTSINEAPAAPQASQDACGTSPQDAFGGQNTPQTIGGLNPKDVTAGQQREDMSSVTGFVVHTAGDLVLVSIPPEPAAGTDSASTPDMAVVRLPAGCSPDLSDGSHVKVVGTPTTQGILNAELIQTTD